MSLVEETEAAFLAANHLTDADHGAMEALRLLARKIDAWDVIVAWALEDAQERGARPAVPQSDNVSISAYLKGCEQLGLTPSGRVALSRAKPAAAEEQKPTKLARVTAMRGGSAKK
jgi:hypothetical protein